MSTWADVPKIQGPPQTQDISVLLGYVKKLADVTAKMAKDLEFILNGNVAFDNIRTNGIETKNLKAGSVIAEKIDVAELSAISADLGHITAGLIEAVEIFGSTITGGTLQTADSGSRIVINDNELKAYDIANTKRVSLGLNDEAGMAGHAYYGPDGNFAGQIYSVLGALHVIAANELFLRGFGSVLIQGDVKFEGSVDFSNATVTGL